MVKVSTLYTVYWLFMSFFANALAFAGNATAGAVSAAVSVAGYQDSINLQVSVCLMSYRVFRDVM